MKKCIFFSFCCMLFVSTMLFSVNSYALQIDNLDKTFRLSAGQSMFITETLSPGEAIDNVKDIYCYMHRADTGGFDRRTEIKVDGKVVRLDFDNNNGDLYIWKGYYQNLRPKHTISFGIQNHDMGNKIDIPQMDITVTCRIASNEIRPVPPIDNIAQPF